MGDYFGLGFVLSVEDNASSAFGSVSESLNNMMDSAQKTFTSMNISGMALTQLGGYAENAGQKVLGSFANIGKSVIDTGATFETFRQTLGTLYNDAQTGAEKVQWAMQLAAKTPFQMEDLTSMVTRMKSIGVEADQVYDDGAGHVQTLAQYIGDLAALHPERGLQMTTQFIQELLEMSPRGTMAMKSLGVSAEALQKAGAGESWGKTTEERIQQLVKVSGYMANGLSEKMMGTWKGLTSNIEDQIERIKLAIADSGMFDMVKATLVKISDAIGNMSNDKIANLGKSISSAFELIWKPIDLAVTGIISFVSWVENLTETSPMLAKIVLGFTALTGVLLVGTGLFLKFSGGILMALASLGMLFSTIVRFGGLGSIFSAIGTSIGGLISSILPTVAVAGILFLAWKNNFIGIRDMMITFVNNTKLAFSEGTRIANMSSQDMIQAVSQLDRHTFFGGLTLAIVKLEVLWTSLCDAWNDNTLSDENFQKARTLGLLPLISAILDLKKDAESMWEGFKNGLSDFMGVAERIASGLGRVFMVVLDYASRLSGAIGELSTHIASVPTAPFEAIGYVLGIIMGIFATAKIVGIITSIVSAIGTIGSAIMGVVGFIGPLVSAIVSTLGAVVSFIGTVVGGIAAVLGLPELLVAAVIGAIIFLIAYWDEVVQSFKDFGSYVGNLFSSIGTAIMEFFAPVGEFFKSLWSGICSFATSAVNVIISVWNGLVNFFYDVFLIIKGIFEIGWAIISGVAKIAFEVIKAVALLAFEGIKVIWNGLVSFFSPIWNAVANGAKYIWSGVTSNARTAYNGLLTVWRPIASFFSSLWNGIKSTASNVWNSVVSVWNSAVAKVKAIWTPIGAFFSNLWHTTASSATTAWNGTTSFFSNLWNTIANYAKTAWQGIVNNFHALVAQVQAIWTPIGAFFSALWQGIVSTAQALWGQITSIAQTVASGVQSAWSGVASFISGVFNSIRTVAESVFTYLAEKFSWVGTTISNIKSALSGINSGVSAGVNDIKSGASGIAHMLGFATGAEIYGEGAAVLHPGEVVVNGDLTSKLRTFLNTNTKQPQTALAGNPYKAQSSDFTTISNRNVSNGGTNSGSNNGNNGGVDNSVNIHEGAIQITMTNGNDVDIKNLAKKIGAEIKRQNQLTNIRNYKPQGGM